MRIFALVLCVMAISCAPPTTKVSVQFVPPCDQQDLLNGLSELQIGEKLFHIRDAYVGSLPERALGDPLPLLIHGTSSQGPLMARVASPAFAFRSENDEPARVLLASPNQFVSVAGVAGKCITLQNDNADATLLGYSVSYVPNVNKVLIVGGVLRAPGKDDKYLNTVQSYDPDTGNFTSLPPLKIARAFHAASASATGKVLIAGGRGEMLNQIKELRPGVIIDLSTPAPTYDEAIMLLPRAFHQATVLNPTGTRVALTGGCSNGCDLSRDELQMSETSFKDASTAIEIIDLDSKARVVKEHALNEGRALHGASIIRDRFVVLSGGIGQAGLLSSIEVYDMQKESMIKDLLKTRLEQPLAGHAQITDSDNNSILLIGGKTAFENGKMAGPSDALTRWDPVRGAQSFGLQLLKPRAAERSFKMSDGSIILVGGNEDNQSFAERLVLDAKYPRSQALSSSIGDIAHAVNGVAISGNRAVVVLGKSPTNASQIKMLTLE